MKKKGNMIYVGFFFVLCKTAVQYMDKNFLHQNNFCSPGAYCVKQEEHTDAERSAVFKA